MVLGAITILWWTQFKFCWYWIVQNSFTHKFMILEWSCWSKVCSIIGKLMKVIFVPQDLIVWIIYHDIKLELFPMIMIDKVTAIKIVSPTSCRQDLILKWNRFSSTKELQVICSFCFQLSLEYYSSYLASEYAVE